MSRLASLTYDAAAERLSGHIPGVGMNGCIDVKAYSGGSRGHSKVKPETAKILRHFEAQSFNSRYANTRTIGEGTDKDPYKQRGGTLPAGHYSCKYHANHPIFHECIRLTRHADTHIRYLTMSGAKLDNRGDDFFIHGSGSKGSDGCLVILDSAARHSLNLAVRDFSKHGSVVLLVTNVSYLLPAELEGALA